MVRKAEEVYREALALSEEEREKLLLLLRNHADPGWASPEIEQAWMEEIDRREQEYVEGKMKLIPADEVFWQARERLRK
jgi:putative addiction module component (TIGR02574 family)